MLPIVKRKKGCQQCPEQNKDEQVLSELSLNKIVGAADTYNLEVECLTGFSFFADLGEVTGLEIKFLSYDHFRRWNPQVNSCAT